MRRSGRSAPRPPWLPGRPRTRHESRWFRFSYLHLGITQRESSHLADHVVDVVLARAETRHARADDRGGVAEPDLGHPCDLPLAQVGEETADGEAAPREAHERQRRAVAD